jgi:hypothetical protein
MGHSAMILAAPDQADERLLDMVLGQGDATGLTVSVN